MNALWMGLFQVGRSSRGAEAGLPDWLWLLGIAAAALFVLVFLIIIFKYGLLYIQAALSGARVGLLELVGMSLRKVAPMTIVTARIMSVKAGIPVDTDKLEAHYLAGGHVDRVVNALISADKANIGLTFQQAAAIDLAGRDVLEAVRVSVNPKVIETPRVAAMAKDGIQLIAADVALEKTVIEALDSSTPAQRG